MRNIQSISDSYLCSNCGACAVVCPHDAIVFGLTNIGRLSTQVNEKCVDCGRCLSVCPSVDESNLHEEFEDRFVGNIDSTYIGKSNDEAYFRNGQSGGVATALLSYLFDHREIDAAVVCRMRSGETPYVEPVIVERREQLAETQKSCYTPVPLLTKLRESGKYDSVAIVGLPCHIEGVVALMRKSQMAYNIRYRIGLVCESTLCGGVQTVIKSITGFDEFRIVWKEKYNEKCGRYNYLNAPMVAQSADGERKTFPKYYRIGLKQMFTPPRCYVCWDKLNVFADITLGDPWQIREVDLVKGESLVVVRTEVGKELIGKMMKESYLSLRRVSDDVPVKSQLIDERRAQVANYSKAFSLIPAVTDTYLRHQEGGEAETDEEKAESVLRKFMANEAKSESEIVDIARNELARIDEEKRRENRIVKRAGDLIVRIIHKFI